MFEEPILSEKNQGVMLLPVNLRYAQFYISGKKQEAANWGADEINNTEHDLRQWNDGTITEHEKNYLKHIIVFFAYADQLIAKNIGCNFLNEIKNIYILYALRIQAAMEDRHAETYSLFANLLVGNEEEINRVRDSVVSMDSVKMKLAWICEWTNEKKHNFATRIFAAELMEGLLFSSSFTGIDFFAKDARMPGLCQANSLIRIDENMHCLTNRDIYDELEYTRLPESRIIDMVRSAVDVESNFAIQSLKYTKKNKITGQMTEVDGFPGLNSQMMVQHIQYVADCIILQKIGRRIYNVKNPMDGVGDKGQESKSNFFEREETSYQHAGVMAFCKKMIEHGVGILKASVREKLQLYGKSDANLANEKKKTNGNTEKQSTTKIISSSKEDIGTSSLQTAKVEKKDCYDLTSFNLDD